MKLGDNKTTEIDASDGCDPAIGSRSNLFDFVKPTEVRLVYAGLTQLDTTDHLWAKQCAVISVSRLQCPFCYSR